MSQSHLRQLRDALTRRGWQITQRLRDDNNVKGAATWELQRNSNTQTLLIDFAGFGAIGEDISLEESYGCNVRGSSVGLYFRRVNRSQHLWIADLTEFVSSLENVATAEHGAAPEHGGT